MWHWVMGKVEVQVAQKTNAYLGVIYASGLLSLFYLMSLEGESIP